MSDIYELFGISGVIKEAAEKAEEMCREDFEKTDKIAEYNAAKVLAAFQKNKVSEACLGSTTGYGYNDIGRDTLDSVYADAFGAEDALVRANIVSGTHALSTALFGVLRTGDTMAAVTGKPYDTLEEVIGIAGEAGNGSLKDFGIKYRQIDLLENGMPDIEGIKANINNNTYFAGNESLMKENNIKLSESEGIYQKLYEQAKTVIFVSDYEKLLGIIAISDTVKQTSIEAINGFKDMKIETYMLTGDNKTSAQAIGKMVGIDNIISEVLPQEKESKVRSLQEQGKIVAMIGDRNK